MNQTSTYDRFPAVAISKDSAECLVGWEDICRTLLPLPAVTVVEVYPGCDTRAIEHALVAGLHPDIVIRSEDALLPAQTIETEVYAKLGDDRVFAFMRPCELDAFFSPERLAELRGRILEATSTVLVIGTGASLVRDSDCRMMYADLSRWEIQRRQRLHQIGNIGVSNEDASPAELYRRAFFVDWRAADRRKAGLLEKVDFVLDTNTVDSPKMITGASLRAAMATTVRRPFRVVPFFDPGPWGGTWMKERFDLPAGPPNYAWCFDCVPEENSVLFHFGDHAFEIPAINLVLTHPLELLGRDIYERFGAEFPIRFDYLDTMGGGNLSLQVHPRTEYIREHFNMPYTQDESYYMLDAAPDATVFLGLKEDIEPMEVMTDLEAAQKDPRRPFPAETYVNVWPAKKHDHFLIPAGTIHCSGRNGLVLEISATPYIFTFKLWDWGRTGLDGKPRPIHLDHGIANMDWSRRTRWTEENLVNATEAIAEGDGWREERTGLHALEFIETRRHWFTNSVTHDTDGTLNVLNLVEGDRAVVESPEGAFPPLEVHYGETFIVPACVGAYRIRPVGPVDKPLATLKAFVRKTVKHA